MDSNNSRAAPRKDSASGSSSDCQSKSGPLSTTIAIATGLDESINTSELPNAVSTPQPTEPTSNSKDAASSDQRSADDLPCRNATEASPNVITPTISNTPIVDHWLTVSPEITGWARASAKAASKNRRIASNHQRRMRMRLRLVWNC